jgi:hypothetical protein
VLSIPPEQIVTAVTTKTMVERERIKCYGEVPDV